LILFLHGAIARLLHSGTLHIFVVIFLSFRLILENIALRQAISCSITQTIRHNIHN
jgi:hypothetical protein